MAVLADQPVLKATAAWWLLVVALVAITVLVYGGSFSGKFVFDDTIWIDDPPPALGPVEDYFRCLYRAGERHLVWLTAVINSRLGQDTPWGWHLVNLAVHVVSGLALFGIVRRTLLSDPMRARFGGVALPLAWVVALVFLIHPLNTQAVTYIWQRAQAMMGMFQLLALYGFVRSQTTTTPKRIGWYVFALLMLAFALDTKPHMVGMILLVPLYDRIFFSPTAERSVVRHWPFYLALTVLWLVSVGGMVQGFQTHTDIGTRGVTADEAGGGTMGRMEYFRAQGEVLVRYIGLTFWPQKLCLDYAWVPPVRWSWNEAPYFAVLGGLGLGTLWALFCRPALGFLGAWFFLNLAASSSFVPRPDVMVEHRMYVPIITIIVLVVVGGWTVISRLAQQGSRWPTVVAWTCVAVVMIALGVRTHLRNQDYQDPVRMWQQVAAIRPLNARAHLNLGTALGQNDRHPEALIAFAAAVRLKPDYAMAHYNYGTSLEKAERYDDALKSYREAARLNQGYAEAWNNIGGTLIKVDRPQDAIAPLEKALALREAQKNPYGVAMNNLGNAYIHLGRYKEALPLLERAVVLRPKLAEAHYNLGNALVYNNRFDEATTAYQTAIAVKKDYAEPWHNLALMYGRKGLHRDALDCDKEALRLKPDYAQAQRTLERWQKILSQPAVEAQPPAQPTLTAPDVVSPMSAVTVRD